MKELAVITAQSEYLKMVSHQLKRIFGDAIEIHPVQLSNLVHDWISENEFVFSAIPKIKKIVTSLFPHVRRFIPVNRSINLANTGELLALRPRTRILVVSDNMSSTQNMIRELEDQNLGHENLPYFPEQHIPEDYEYVVTTGDLPLAHDLKIVPRDFPNIINLGFRVLSLETIFATNDQLDLALDPVTLSKSYFSSLISVTHRWPFSKRNKYISTWVGESRTRKATFRLTDFVAKSQIMRDLIFRTQQMAGRPDPVHISGEMGVGKDRLAQAIHNASSLRAKTFGTINCSRRNPDALEKELFGWEKGGNIYPGLFEIASGGTLCIQEIDQMSPELQIRLVQVLDEKTVLRRNGSLFIPVNVRILTTSIPTIHALFQNNLIQKELYYRLSHFTCHIPSLEERSEDFDDLMYRYLHNEFNRPDLTMDLDTARILKNQHWEGNLQELHNVLAHVACLADTRITPDLLPFYIDRNARGSVKTGITETHNDSHFLITQIEQNGFLDESQAILEIFSEGKRENRSFGRTTVCALLKKRRIELTPQQLRLRQQRLNRMGLLRVRRGRAGTTISQKGEKLLHFIQQLKNDRELH